MAGRKPASLQTEYQAHYFFIWPYTNQSVMHLSYTVNKNPISKYSEEFWHTLVINGSDVLSACSNIWPTILVHTYLYHVLTCISLTTMCMELSTILIKFRPYKILALVSLGHEFVIKLPNSNDNTNEKLN